MFVVTKNSWALSANSRRTIMEREKMMPRSSKNAYINFLPVII